MVVEDFERIGELLDIFLTKAGFTVFVAGTGKDALLFAEKEKPDLILLDVQLPDGDGMDVLRKIRSFDRAVKIYVLSGLYAEDMEKESLSNGATGFISKSLGIEAIVNAATKALR